MLKVEEREYLCDSGADLGRLESEKKFPQKTLIWQITMIWQITLIYDVLIATRRREMLCKNMDF